ncbi:MAG: hypothetical protein AAFV95_22565 [Bacteroidota bacterium]
MRAFYILSMSLLLTTAAFGQKKVSGAMGKFLQTEFMTTYMNLKIEAENAVKTFQSNQDRYQVQDVSRVRAEYDKIAAQFNALLEGVKNDFLNKKKLKYIEKFPDSYSDGLQMKLYKLSDHYAKGFQQSLADATANEIDGVAVLLLIGEIIGLTKGMSDYFSKLRREARRYNQAYLHKHLVSPHRWKSWDEIAGRSAAPNYHQPDREFDPSSVQLRIPNSRNNGFDNGDFNNSGQNDWDDNTGDFNDDSFDNDNGQNDWNEDSNNSNGSSDDTFDYQNSNPDEEDDWNNTARGNVPGGQGESTNQQPNPSQDDPFIYGNWQTGQPDSTKSNQRKYQKGKLQKQRKQ